MSRFTFWKKTLLSAGLIAFLGAFPGVGQAASPASVSSAHAAAGPSRPAPKNAQAASGPSKFMGFKPMSHPRSRVMPVRGLMAQSLKQQLAAMAKTGPKAAGAKAEVATSGTPSINFPGFFSSDAFAPATAGSDTQFVLASVTADVNKDGLADIVDLQADGTLNVLLNPGSGKLGNLAVTSTNGKAAALGADIEMMSALDLNGDGYPDIAAADYANNDVLIWLNRKDGTFADPTSFPVAFQYSSLYNSLYTGGAGTILFGDINGDGVTDLVTLIFTTNVESSGSASTLMELVAYPGLTGGGFGQALPEEYATFAGSPLILIPNQAQLADMNKDGKLDLVFYAGVYQVTLGPQGEAPAYVSVLTGDGTGKFSPLPTGPASATATIPNVSSVLAGFTVQDVDGDGNLDVLLSAADGDSDSSVYLLQGNGSGTLGQPTSVLSGLVGGTTFYLTDMNGDGVADLVTYYDGGLSVYPGTGKGAFASAATTQIVAGVIGNQEPMPADMDGDGTPDLAQVDSLLRQAAVFLEKNGSYDGAMLLAPGGESPSSNVLYAVGDYNNDGAQDVLFSAATYQNVITANTEDVFPLDVAVNDGKGNFTYKNVVSGQTLAASSVTAVQPIFADFNHDGFADILWSSSPTNASVLLQIVLSNADGTYNAPKTISSGADMHCPMGLAVAGDLNGDGNLDLVVAYPGDGGTGLGGYSCNPANSGTPSGLFTLIGDGKGGFTSTFTAHGSNDLIPVLADFNGDGVQDLAVSDFPGYFNPYPSKVWMIAGVGDGTFDINDQKEAFQGQAAVSIIPGDFDGDGKQDLTVGVFNANNFFQGIAGSTGVALMKGNGDLTFGSPQFYADGNIVFDGSYADFNGDGLPDLAINTLGTFIYTDDPKQAVGGLAYLPNVGNGALGGMLRLVAGSESDDTDGMSMFTADFNGDGAPDVVNDSGLGAGIYLNKGAISLALSGSGGSVAQGSGVTVTATLTPSINTAQPSGTISFYDNGTLLQTQGVTGTATVLTLGSLSVGQHSITATYSGDSQYNGAKSASALSITVTALAPSFTLSPPAQTSMTLTQGATGVTTVTLAANATFNGAIALTCSGAPSEASCTVSPSSVTLAGAQTATATVVVTTTVKNNKQSAANTMPSFLKGVSGIAVAGLVLLLPGRIRRVRGVWLTLVLAAGVLATLSVSGCGSSSKYSGTPIGNSTITITATSGSVTQSQTISLSVN